MIELKTKQDIDVIRRAGDILGAAIRAVADSLAPGVTTGELDAIAKNEIVARGGQPSFIGYHGYPGALCISVNEQVIHGIPGKRRLEAGDIVGIDLGVTFENRIADAAVTLSVGRADEEDARLMKTAEACLHRGIDQARAGRRLREVSEAIYETARAAGFDVVREYCGHGVGFSLHEDPQVYNYPSSGPNPKLKVGMVLAIEPMVNAGTWKVNLLEDGWTVVTADGKKSAHYEHTIAITDAAPDILTRWQ
jgi:methionyl aminopeptidase